MTQLSLWWTPLSLPPLLVLLLQESLRAAFSREGAHGCRLFEEAAQQQQLQQLSGGSSGRSGPPSRRACSSSRQGAGTVGSAGPP